MNSVYYNMDRVHTSHSKEKKRSATKGIVNISTHDSANQHLTPRLCDKIKSSAQKKTKHKESRNVKQKINATAGPTTNSPYEILLKKFKNNKELSSKPKGNFSSRMGVDTKSHSPNKIFRKSSRSNSKTKKKKTTSSLTKWLQKLLESHSKKSKERNVIDYFIYAIYTVLADTKKTRERISSCVPFLRIIREMYPNLISHFYRNPSDEMQKFYNIQLYLKCLISIEVPIHKRIVKEKLKPSYEINEMLDHIYDLFQHIAKDLAPIQVSSISKGCQKTIEKFSKKLKDMIKYKGDFYLPKSREASPYKDNENNQDSEEYFEHFDSKQMSTQMINQNELALTSSFENANGVGGIPNSILANLNKTHTVSINQETEGFGTPSHDQDYGLILEEIKNSYELQISKMKEDYNWRLKEKDIGCETRLAELNEEHDITVNQLKEIIIKYEQEIDTLKYNHILKIEEVYDLQKKIESQQIDKISDSTVVLLEKESQTSKIILQLHSNEVVNVLSKMKDDILAVNQAQTCVALTQTDIVEAFDEETITIITPDKIFASIEVQVVTETLSGITQTEEQAKDCCLEEETQTEYFIAEEEIQTEYILTEKEMQTDYDGIGEAVQTEYNLNEEEIQTEYICTEVEMQTEMFKNLSDIGINTDYIPDILEEKKSDFDFNLSMIPTVETASVHIQTHQVLLESKEMNTSIEEDNLNNKSINDQEINTSFEVFINKPETNDAELNTSIEEIIPPKELCDQNNNTSFEIMQVKPQTFEAEQNTSLEEIISPKEHAEKDQNTSFIIEIEKPDTKDCEINTSFQEILLPKDLCDHDQNTSFEVLLDKPEVTDVEVNTSIEEAPICTEKEDKSHNTSFEIVLKQISNDVEINTSLEEPELLNEMIDQQLNTSIEIIPESAETNDAEINTSFVEEQVQKEVIDKDQNTSFELVPANIIVEKDNEISELNKKYTSTLSSSKLLQNTINSLQSEVNELMENQMNLEDDKNAEIAHINLQVTQLDKKLTDLTKTNETITEELKEKDEKLKSMNREKVQLQITIEDLEHSNLLKIQEIEKQSENIQKQYAMKITDSERENQDLKAQKEPLEELVISLGKYSTKIEEVINLQKEENKESSKNSPVELKKAVHNLKRMSQMISQRKSISDVMRMKTEPTEDPKNKHSVKYQSMNEDSMLSPVEDLINSRVEIQIDEHSEESKDSVLSLTAIPKLKTEGDMKKISNWPELEESDHQKSDEDSDGSQQLTDEEEVISNNSGDSVGLSQGSDKPKSKNKSNSYQDSEEDDKDDEDEDDDD